jgi:hypothetical protein
MLINLLAQRLPPVDLLSEGCLHWEHAGRHYVEFPSLLFVLKCQQTDYQGIY